jgi:hypothetical protein
MRTCLQLTEALISLAIARRSSCLDLRRQALHRTLASKARSPPAGAQNDVVRVGVGRAGIVVGIQLHRRIDDALLPLSRARVGISEMPSRCCCSVRCLTFLPLPLSVCLKPFTSSSSSSSPRAPFPSPRRYAASAARAASASSSCCGMTIDGACSTCGTASSAAGPLGTCVGSVLAGSGWEVGGEASCEELTAGAALLLFRACAV